MAWQSVPLLCAALALAMFTGCEPTDPSDSAHGPDTLDPPPPSPWKMADTSPQIALPAGEVDAEMQAAIAQARRTAAQAGRRWRDTPATQQDRWFVKWAAPTADNRIEYVWVQPSSWSDFRIEGFLRNPPQSPLACGARPGHAVSFPADQLADWLHLPDGTLTGRREGGFTLALLEQRYGPAAPSEDGPAP